LDLTVNILHNESQGTKSISYLVYFRSDMELDDNEEEHILVLKTKGVGLLG